MVVAPAQIADGIERGPAAIEVAFDAGLLQAHLARRGKSGVEAHAAAKPQPVEHQHGAMRARGIERCRHVGASGAQVAGNVGSEEADFADRLEACAQQHVIVDMAACVERQLAVDAAGLGIQARQPAARKPRLPVMRAASNTGAAVTAQRHSQRRIGTCVQRSCSRQSIQAPSTCRRRPRMRAAGLPPRPETDEFAAHPGGA